MRILVSILYIFDGHDTLFSILKAIHAGPSLVSGTMALCQGPRASKGRRPALRPLIVTKDRNYKFSIRL